MTAFLYFILHLTDLSSSFLVQLGKRFVKDDKSQICKKKKKNNFFFEANKTFWVMCTRRQHNCCLTAKMNTNRQPELIHKYSHSPLQGIPKKQNRNIVAVTGALKKKIHVWQWERAWRYEMSKGTKPVYFFVQNALKIQVTSHILF